MSHLIPPDGTVKVGEPAVKIIYLSVEPAISPISLVPPDGLIIELLFNILNEPALVFAIRQSVIPSDMLPYPLIPCIISILLYDQTIITYIV